MRKAKICGALIVVLAAAILAGMFARPVWAQVRAALVRDVDTPSLAPFHASVEYDLSYLNEQRLLTTVPAGKRLVIEYLSFESGGATGDELVFAALRTGQMGPLTVILEIHPPHAAAAAGFTLQDGSQPVKAYFEAGEQVWVTVSHNTGSPSRDFRLIAWGHYIVP